MEPTNILIGSLLSFGVHQLKRIPFVNKYPKVVTSIFSVAIPAGLSVYAAATGKNLDSIADLSTQAAIIFTSAVATHETITKTVTDKVL